VLVRRRWITFLTAAAVCFGLAAVIEVIEYRLLVFAIVVAFPAVLPLIDLVFVRRYARQMGAAEVRLDGRTLTFKPGLSVDVGALRFVRVQPDVLYLNERWGPGPKQVRMYLLPAEGEAARAVTDRLQALGVKVVVEKMTVAQGILAFWGLMAQFGLNALAGLLLSVGILYGGISLVADEELNWDIYACFGGAAVAFALRALILHFLPPEAKAPVNRG
jgi:hypothetical protein